MPAAQSNEVAEQKRDRVKVFCSKSQLHSTDLHKVFTVACTSFNLYSGAALSTARAVVSASSCPWLFAELSVLCLPLLVPSSMACLQLCAAMTAEIEQYKQHTAQQPRGSPASRAAATSPGGAGPSSSGASAAAVTELEQQLLATKQQLTELQQKLDDTTQEAENSISTLRLQLAQERDELARARADLAQVRGWCESVSCTFPALYNAFPKALVLLAGLLWQCQNIPSQHVCTAQQVSRDA